MERSSTNQLDCEEMADEEGEWQKEIAEPVNKRIRSDDFDGAVSLACSSGHSIEELNALRVEGADVNGMDEVRIVSSVDFSCINSIDSGRKDLASLVVRATAS